MKKYIFILLMTIVMFAVAACNSNPNSPSSGQSSNSPSSDSESVKVPDTVPEKMKDLYLAALEEGELTFWTATDVDEIKELESMFNETYPGIKVNHFEIQPGEAAQRYITEHAANKVGVDVMDGAIRFFAPITERDLAQQLNFEDYGVTETYAENRYLTEYHLSYPIGVNTDLVSEDEIPKTWEDILDPKWDGKIIFESRAGALAVLAQEWGEERAREYLDRLLQLNPIITRGGTPTSQALAAGEGAFAIGTYAYRLENLKNEGAPVDWARTDVIPAGNYVLAVLDKAPHPNAGALWIIWLNSAEGTKALEKARGSAKLTGPHISSLGQKMKDADVKVIVEDEKNAEKTSALSEEFSKRVSSLR